MGRRVTPGIILLMTLAITGSVWPQTPRKPAVTVTRASGGSIQTILSAAPNTILLNKESSLTREWLALHDPSLPADLVGTPGVTTVHLPDRGRGEYHYQAKLSVQAKEALTAVEIRFLVFDVWGQHVRTLLSDEVADLPAGSTKDILAHWQLYSESEGSRYYASIAYISRARTKDGRVVEADPDPILREAQRFSKKLTVADLEPKAEPR